MKRLLIAIKNILLWSYARGTWQYDILWLLILGAVFLLPSSFFGDRPLQAQKGADQANRALKIASKEADKTQWEIGVKELRAFLRDRNEPEQLMNNPPEAIVLYLNAHLKREVAPGEIRFEARRDERGEVIGYRVWF